MNLLSPERVMAHTPHRHREEVRSSLAPTEHSLFSRASRLSVITLAALLCATEARACAVCFGDPGSPMTIGMNKAIWALLGITGVVLGLFVAFFLFLWRRARTFRHAPIDTGWIEGLRGIKHV